MLIMAMDKSSKSDFQDASVKTPAQSKGEKFTALLKQMNLHERYHQKLSFKEAVTIRQETLENIHTTDKLPVLPYLILQKIMMCDQRCRSSLFKTPSLTAQSQPTGSDSELSDSDSDDADDDGLHPVDCMLALLHCCDDILRQELFSKLSLCQLALPFLLPNPTDNSVTFLLWAMRSLFRGWKCYKSGKKECRIVDYQGPIVSFLRIGNPQASKSEILNAVIGGESKIFFYHRGCEGGYCKKNFVDGLVEMCSYFPSGNKSDHFSDAVTFLNLRGDAQQHPKQVEFLQKISCMSVVLISDTDTNDVTVETLMQLAKADGGIILLCDEAIDKETKSRAKQLLEDLPNSSKIKVIDRTMVKSIATLKKEVQNNLVEKISQVATEKHLAISKCCQIARDANIKIDEDNEDSKAGKRYADMVMEKINLDQTKDKMLPLQGQSLWHKWAKHDKERYRHAENKKTNVTDYNAQQDDEKRKVRKKQVHFCTHLTPVMDCFLKYLLEKNITIREYFLLWLKLFLDDHSRETLQQLHAVYQETRDQLYALKCGYQSKNNSKIVELTEKLKIQNQELIHASFGLEHLFREICQIFEACKDFSGCTVSKTLQDNVEHFPTIIAEIMEEGLHALELIDGDASHVPTLWALAVIEKLKAACGKNAREKSSGKILVLSVLGIKSTGKSTLLNTLFGLRFNVGTSAGRCTRGAYIQLLPLDNSLRQHIDCDYIMVVDTEGLRAPEPQFTGQQHDNELATFVIGIADATIINIYGKAPGDLDDILQTSVHAFICMRNVEMNPSCLFVHQNVPDVLASSKSKMGRQKFHNKLDEMTLAAARVEHCDGIYHSFCQVIDFDDNKHVFYFPSLWKGDPPMAPVNTGYSEKAQTLKTALINYRTSRCTLGTFQLRVQQIWQAVLQENFVFSFKNTLEVCAYNELDSQYIEWSWSLRSKMLEWENATKLKIINFDTETEAKMKQQIKELKAESDKHKSEIKRSIIYEEIERTKESCLTTAKSEIFKNHSDTLQKMETFLDTADHSETLSQWRHQTEKKLKELHDDCEKKAESYCKELVKNKLYCVEVDHQDQCSKN